MIKTLENAIFSADTKKHTKYKEYGMNGLWQFFEEAHKKMLKNTFDQLRKKTNVARFFLIAKPLAKMFIRQNKIEPPASSGKYRIKTHSIQSSKYSFSSRSAKPIGFFWQLYKQSLLKDDRGNFSL